MLLRSSIFIIFLLPLSWCAEQRLLDKLKVKMPIWKKNAAEVVKPTENRAFITIHRTRTVTETTTVLPTCSVAVPGLPDCSSRAKRLLDWNPGYLDYFVVLNPAPVHRTVIQTVLPDQNYNFESRLGVPELEPSMSRDSESRLFFGMKKIFQKDGNQFATFQYTNITVSVTVTDSRRTVTVSPVCKIPDQGKIPECEDEGSGQQPVQLGKLLNLDAYPEFWTQEMEDSIFSGEEDEFILVKPKDVSKRSIDVVPKKEASKPEKECEEGWKMYCDRSMNCKCFTVPNIYTTWKKAEHHCQKLNAEFISVKNNKENKFLSDFLEDMALSKVFIAAQRFNETSFRWLDGSSVKFDKWEDGEPIYDCAAVLQENTNNRWVTVKCGETGQFVCRKNAVWKKKRK